MSDIWSSFVSVYPTYQNRRCAFRPIRAERDDGAAVPLFSMPSAALAQIGVFSGSIASVWLVVDERESGEHFVRRILLSVALTVALSATVDAAQPAAAGKAAQPPYPQILTRAELRACMLRERDIDARNQAFEAERVAHDEALAGVAEEAKALAKELSAVPPSDESAVGRYNAKVDQRNKVVDALNKQAEAMNARLALIRADTVDYMNECASKVFNKADEQALIKELGARPAIRRNLPLAPTPQQPRPIEV